MDRFRDYLDHLCRRRGVQYAELARRIGVTKSYVGQLVHGHAKPPPRERCLQIADALELAPDEREALLDLAVRERARDDARSKIEELGGDVAALRSATGDVLAGLLAAAGSDREKLPEPLVDLFGEDALLGDLYNIVAADRPDVRDALAARVAGVSPDRLAAEVKALASAIGAAAGSLTPSEMAPPSRDVPVIGHVAAGETEIAFTDGGLPAGMSLPGEEPIPRWHGLGEHTYALRIAGESMMPLCPPGATIVVDPDRTPRNGEPGICQTTEGKTYFKLIYSEPSGQVRLVSTNSAVASDIVLRRSQVRRLQKVVATIYP